MNDIPAFPISDAPTNGTVIEGLYDEGWIEIRYAEQRRCMLAGIGGGNGYFGPGWEDVYNGLIIDTPMREAEEWLFYQIFLNRKKMRLNFLD